MTTKKSCIERHYYQIEAEWLALTAGSCKTQCQMISDKIQSEENEEEKERLYVLYDFMRGCYTALKNIKRAPNDPSEAGSYFASLDFEKPLLGGNDDE